MYHPLHLKHFKSKYINHKDISEEFIKTIMQQSASECPFSTFPYIFGMNSEQANQHHNTGNCVALSMFLRDKLKKHGIKSILIPATIPKMYSNPNYLNISHVALAILIGYHDAYICDPAFYFMEPMKISSKSNDIKHILSQNIYANTPEPLTYQLKFQSQDDILNQYQKIPEQSFHVETYKTDDPLDKWKYYLMEVINPDKAISSFYISTKNLPFIACVDDNFQMTLYIKFLDKQTISIKMGNQELYYGHFTSIPDNIKDIIKPCMQKHFGLSFDKYFNLPHDVSDKLYEIKDTPPKKKKTIRRKR